MIKCDRPESALWFEVAVALFAIAAILFLLFYVGSSLPLVELDPCQFYYLNAGTDACQLHCF